MRNPSLRFLGARACASSGQRAQNRVRPRHRHGVRARAGVHLGRGQGRRQRRQIHCFLHSGDGGRAGKLRLRSCREDMQAGGSHWQHELRAARGQGSKYHKGS